VDLETKEVQVSELRGVVEIIIRDGTDTDKYQINGLDDVYWTDDREEVLEIIRKQLEVSR
jgi:hypothetical protein